jgi:predicted nucleic acid-binding protein
VKIYLDNSFLNRPFDDLSFAQNRLEAEILDVVIGLVDKGNLQLVNSDVIEYENSLNPFPDRKEFVDSVVGRASQYLGFSDDIQKKARKLENELKLKPLDALHVASAVASQVDLFITCDQELVKKCNGRFNVTTPMSAIKQYENDR